MEANRIDANRIDANRIDAKDRQHPSRMLTISTPPWRTEKVTFPAQSPGLSGPSLLSTFMSV